ncbi:UL16-binding protein 2-like [Canis lupus familiaris]|uniref:UL16-binding protein 2-like n=1 Tax=Canis lupus familiaris TaxID=9615 RepID=UPI0018F62EA8|nr:UL16-binding protein 2-like [Canis lupus familiaris]
MDGTEVLPLSSSNSNHYLRFYFTGATSLFCEFSVKPQSSAGRPWCEVRGYVKRNLFLSYNCQSKELTLVGPMRTRMNDTGFRETQKETLNDLMEELQKKVRDIKAEIYPKNGSLDLHGEMKCVRGASRYTSASWWSLPSMGR